MLRPIPLSVLCDTIILKSYVGDNGYGLGDIYTDYTITNVRVQQDSKVTIDSFGNPTRTNGNIIFVDIKNSKGFSEHKIFTTGSKVVYDGNEYTIDSVEIIKGYSSVHHLEVFVC